jgi:zinc protease
MCLKLVLLTSAMACGTLWAQDYVVVVSTRTETNAGWRDVVAELRQKHAAAVVSYRESVEEALPTLRKLFPRYVCFVAPPAEASREFVAQVHRLTRRLNDDPYPDCLWGILTGFDASNALRIARCSEPLTIHKVAAGTPIPLQRFDEGRWYSEWDAGLMMTRERGAQPRETRVAADTTEALVKSLTDYGADMFVTSGHATERDWQIGYRCHNGQFRCRQGVLFGLDTQARRFPVHSANPKVYLPVGNCLMGHIDGTEAMALAFMNSAGVNQMLGYTVNTWYGYAGWGCLDYFVEQPGRFTLAEAFFANEAALIHRLQMYFPELVAAPFDPMSKATPPIKLSAAARAAGLKEQDGLGLLYDRDALAFYGDPAWEARLAPQPTAWEQNLSLTNGVWRFEVLPRRGERSFITGDINGSQRGGRPIVQLLPEPLDSIQVVEGQECQPVITSRFILVPNPGKCEPAKTYRISFRAERLMLR